MTKAPYGTLVGTLIQQPHYPCQYGGILYNGPYYCTMEVRFCDKEPGKTYFINHSPCMLAADHCYCDLGYCDLDAFCTGEYGVTFGIIA
jgi:hypothetical protein